MFLFAIAVVMDDNVSGIINWWERRKESKARARLEQLTRADRVKETK